MRFAVTTAGKAAAIMFAALGLAAAAGSASAAGRATDVDFLKANRCKGLAVGLGADTTGLAGYIRDQGATRLDAVLEQGDQEYARAKRQAADANVKAKLEAELTGPCSAYLGGGRAMAGGAAASTH